MKKILSLFVALLIATTPIANAQSDANNFLEAMTHGYADSNGVHIHYAELGQGPLVVMIRLVVMIPSVVMIHGFADYWYTWRHQMQALADTHRVVAIDQPGYNKSDAPTGIESYALSALMGDVAAVIQHVGEEKAIIIGHDRGTSVPCNSPSTCLR
jgi:pimeloyl-ACP methyl ester carboxylesterase